MSGRLPYHVNQENHPPASPGGGVPLGADDSFYQPL